MVTRYMARIFRSWYYALCASAKREEGEPCKRDLSGMVIGDSAADLT
jgi:hypothetical protein